MFRCLVICTSIAGLRLRYDTYSFFALEVLWSSNGSFLCSGSITRGLSDQQRIVIGVVCIASKVTV